MTGCEWAPTILEMPVAHLSPILHLPFSTMSPESAIDQSPGRLFIPEGEGQRGGREHTLAMFRTGPTPTSVSLRAPYLVYYGLLAGQAVVRGPDAQDQNLQAGQSILVPPLRSLRLYFGTNEVDQARWVALKVDRDRVRSILDELNPAPGPGQQEWALQEQPYCSIEGAEGIHRTLQMIAFVFEEDPPQRNPLIDLNVRQLLIHLLQTQARPLLTSGYARHSADGGIAAAVQYIQDHLDRHISIDELVEEACMSKSSFYRHFSEEFDMSPLEYITQERVSRARELLTNQATTVAEVSHALGFSSTSYFIDMFKEHVGKTPKQYQLDVTAAAVSASE